LLTEALTARRTHPQILLFTEPPSRSDPAVWREEGGAMVAASFVSHMMVGEDPRVDHTLTYRHCEG
jgi:hypothetical protein